MSLINLLSTATLGLLSLWYKLYGHHPDLTYLKVFGCTCYPLLRPYTHHELENRTKECLFLGYSTVSKGYLCLNLTTNHLYTSRHVLFNESKFLFMSFTASKSATDVSQLSHDIWLSNLLYLHSTNQPSVLGPYITSATILLDSSPTISPTPMPQVQPVTFNAPSSPIPHVDDAFVLSSDFPTPPIQPPSTISHNTILTDHIPIPTDIAIPTLPPVTNTHSMTTRSKNGITKPKLCFKAILDYTYTKPPS